MHDVPLDPQSLELILAKEVEDLTDEDLTQLISHHRAERAQFRADEAAGKKPGRKISASSSKTSAKSEELLKLAEGLDLDI